MTETTATDATAAGPVATTPPGAQRTAAGEGDAYWFFDSLMVVRANQPGQPVIIEATVAPGGGVQGTQPVGQALTPVVGHRRRTRDATPDTPERRRARSASPAASSSALSDPVSPSQAATPRRPWRTRSCFSAADESHLLKETPSWRAASSTAVATSSSSETERLVTMDRG